MNGMQGDNFDSYQSCNSDINRQSLSCYKMHAKVSTVPFRHSPQTTLQAMPQTASRTNTSAALSECSGLFLGKNFIKMPKESLPAINNDKIDSFILQTIPVDRMKDVAKNSTYRVNF